MGGTATPTGGVFFRLLLRLYPEAHRRRYAGEMEACFRRDLERSGGGVGFWTGLVWDHLRAAAAVRRRTRREREGRMRTMLDDVRHAWRALRRAPLFTASVTLVLALGIGATTAAFGVLDRVVLRPLPYPEAGRIVVAGPAREDDPGRASGLSAPLMLALQRSPGPATDVVGVARGYSVLTGLGDAERIYPVEVTTGFFRFFGARAAVGRLFAEDDHRPGAEPVAVLDHGTWTSRFGGDPSVVGRSVVLDSVPRRVVGVLAPGWMPPETLFRGASEIWVPLPLAERADQRRVYTISAVARLGAGARPSDLEAHTARVVEEVYDGFPSRVVGAAVESLRDRTVGEIGSVLWQVFAAVGLLLGIACVNVASLLLTRVTERARELAVRSALGAGRGRLIRQLLFESVLLALAGAVSGALLAFAALEAFKGLSPGGVPRLAEVTLDGRALAFSAAAALATVIVFGLLPAVRAASRTGSTLVGRGTPDGADGRLRGTLVLAETALAVVLVVGSGLLTHDLVRRLQADPGYRPEGLVAAGVSLPFEHYRETERRAAFWSEFLEGARALPGVASAALTSELPTTGFSFGMDATPEGLEEGEMISMARVGEDLHLRLGLRVVEGRWFSELEAEEGEVVLVNEAFLRAYWAAAPSALGRAIHRGDETWRVIGVVGDAHVEPGVAPRPKVYLPLRRNLASELVVRADGDPTTVALALRALVRRIDPGLVDVDVRTVASLNADALARPRFYTALFSGFGLAAFLLALVGVWGTTSYATRSRTREIGIRMALGARRARVVGEVVAGTTLVLAAGVAVGLGAAVLGSRVLTDALVTIGPRHPSTYVIVAALVLAAGVTSALLPASRASRVDPARTLREER